MMFDRKIVESITREKRELNGVKIEDLREYGYCLLEEIYHNEIEEEIKVEIYELDCKTYLIRCIDDRCVMFRDITASNN